MPTEYMTVEAKQVRVSDYVFNQHAYHPSASWVQVTSTERREQNPGSDLGCTIIIRTRVYDTWKHHGEGVAIKRVSD